MRKNKAGAKQNGFSMMTLDDDPSITSALQAYFEASGFFVETENDPVRALERLREKPFDILLLDFLMQPLCGDEVVSRLRAFDSDIFIILLTGHREMAPPLTRVRALDIQGYYEKSDRFDQLELLVESCVKSIRQMRIIRDYRDGLGRVLTASTKIHRLAPIIQIMEQAIEQALPLVGTNGMFIWADPARAESGRDDAPLDFSNGLYCGDGQYRASLEEFCASILPGLREVIDDAMIRCEAVSRQGYLIAPLLTVEGRPFGVLVADALAKADDDLARLIELYARQTASALSNATLYAVVQDKNRAITDALTQLNSNYMEMISVLRQVVDAKDIYTRGHSDRVSYYSRELAEAVGLSAAQQERVRVAGLFHDVGKVGVSELILTKAGKLSEEEFEEIKKHPALGAKILDSMSMFKGLPGIVGAHHERLDGSGYPYGLKGDAIPIEARIITIADSFDAMTSARHYRASLGYEKAVEELQKFSGIQFDAALVDAFIGLLSTRYDRMQEDLASTYDANMGGAT